MLKSVIAAACLGAASMAVAQSSGLSGHQIGDLVAGTTVEIHTPAGTKLPIRYASDGKLFGEARDLAWYLGTVSDKGRWWVAADQLCHRWNRWFNSQPQCMRLSKEGRLIRWRSQDGHTGIAMISVPAGTQTAAMLRRVRPDRFEEVAPPAAAPEPPPVQPDQDAGQPPQPAAEQPVAEAPPPEASAVPAPTALDKSPPPEKEAEPKRTAQPMFKVANVRSDDVLNVRSGPSADFDIVGELPPGSRGIAITNACRSKWCPVQHGSTSGWVNSTFLAPEQLPPPALRLEAPRACLTPAARALLDRIEQRFGPVRVMSTCRPGALIAGTGYLSRHASGNAVDFDAGSRKAAIIAWLIANHRDGGTMTYPDMDHIHVDIGPHFVAIANGPNGRSWHDSRGDFPGPPADLRR